MQDNISIQVEHVTKEFRLQAGTRTLKSAALDILRRSKRTGMFRALDDMSFEVARGKTLGIIGANGAGKSTLLSIVAGTMAVTRGSVRSRGTISSLLELGAGFHPDLTGRENVFLYGAIMGLNRKQMHERFDDIIAFAGIADYIDQPVKHYSSGMYVRLGFAVAVEVDPDILLIDEVLAVGDADFQRKCIAKMNDFRSEGKTMLIISHDMGTIQSISDEILLLDHGKIVGMGSPNSIVDTYRSLSRTVDTEGLAREWGTGEIRITGVQLCDKDGKECRDFSWNSSLEAKISYKASAPVVAPVFGFSISDRNGRVIYGNNTQIEGLTVPDVAGEGTISLRIDKLNMASDTYLLSFSIHSADHLTNYHRLDNGFPISVNSDKPFEGCCYMDTSWTWTQ